jgi:hypothetical protein
MEVVICIIAILWAVIAIVSLCPFRRRCCSDNA